MHLLFFLHIKVLYLLFLSYLPNHLRIQKIAIGHPASFVFYCNLLKTNRIKKHM